MGAFEGGSPLEGHVAFVEAVNADGTILVSEDAWHADGSGPLRFRTVGASSVTNFIHYGDHAGRLRQVVATPGRWVTLDAGIFISGEIAAVNTCSPWPTIMVSQGGTLFRLDHDQSGWVVMRAESCRGCGLTAHGGTRTIPGLPPTGPSAQSISTAHRTS